jgi:hypothetical protein
MYFTQWVSGSCSGTPWMKSRTCQGFPMAFIPLLMIPQGGVRWDRFWKGALLFSLPDHNLSGTTGSGVQINCQLLGQEHYRPFKYHKSSAVVLKMSGKPHAIVTLSSDNLVVRFLKWEKKRQWNYIEIARNVTALRRQLQWIRVSHRNKLSTLMKDFGVDEPSGRFGSKPCYCKT